jgi:hypothetical protein
MFHVPARPSEREIAAVVPRRDPGGSLAGRVVRDPRNPLSRSGIFSKSSPDECEIPTERDIKVSNIAGISWTFAKAIGTEYDTLTIVRLRRRAHGTGTQSVQPTRPRDIAFLWSGDRCYLSGRGSGGTRCEW